MRIRKSVFDGPIQDEVELAQHARQLLKNLSTPPTKGEILKLAETHSVDIATRCFYDGMRNSKHKDVINKIESQPVKPIENKNEILLYIVPGMFHKEHPELGTNGVLIKKIAQKFGIQTKFIDIKSTGSIAENAKILEKELSRETHSNIWLLSISKGSCDVRSVLQSNIRSDRVVGWINIAGIHKGVPFIDKAFNSIFSRIYLRLIAIIFRIKFTVFKELRTSEQFWQNKKWQEGIDIIHIVPVPLLTHVHNSILNRYKQTLTHGPNDGFVPLVDVLEMPGCIYPIWGYDHYLRTPELSQLLHKLFNYIGFNNNNSHQN